MSKVENPNDVVVVSRREWLQVVAMAGAAGAVPAEAMGQCQPPSHISYNYSDFYGKGFRCSVPQLNGSSDQFLGEGQELPWGLIAAFTALISRDESVFGYALVPDPHDKSQKPQYDTVSALVSELGLDAAKWGNVRTSLLAKKTGYEANRKAAAQLWHDICHAYDKGYPSSQDQAIWQTKVISCLAQSDGKWGRASKVK